MAHRMMDVAGRWLLMDERNSHQMLEEVVREGFVLALANIPGGGNQPG